ncbi:MAG TPA: AAA family ATPase [Candidatus Norongarragalinales archaeon]|nr:AAA family ATPase [Candidatus Norongarragalinales archaeon]
MDKLFSTSSEQSRIFRNQSALMPEFVPGALLHREREVREIADSLSPLLKHSRPQNLLIHGPTGSGKTSCAKYVLNELGEYSSKIRCIYINCWEHPSKQAILSFVAEGLREPLPRRGLADDEIFHRIIERLKYDKKAVVVVLDEIDRLMHKNEAEVLYNLSRSEENYGVAFGILGITNVPEIYFSLDERMRSSLRFREMAFEKYSPGQLKEILKERAREALLAGAFSEEIIALCAAHGARNNGDARVAIEALLQAGMRADSKGKARIEIADVKGVFEKSAEASLTKNVKLMGENEKILLQLLKDAKAKGKILTSGEIYSKFNLLRQKSSLEPISERQIMNYLQMFEAARMISAELADDPRTGSGKTKLIKLIR